MQAVYISKTLLRNNMVKFHKYRRKLRARKWPPKAYGEKQKHTLHRLSQIITTSLAVNDILVNLACSYIVVTVQRYVKEALVVAEVKVNLTAIVQHKNLAYKDSDYIIKARSSCRPTLLLDTSHWIVKTCYSLLLIYSVWLVMGNIILFKCECHGYSLAHPCTTVF